jgi:ribosomal protein L40E
MRRLSHRLDDGFGRHVSATGRIGRCGARDPPAARVCRHSLKETTMADLTTKKRNAEPKSDFGLPAERKYPMPDRSHAANAKARASQQKKKGNLTAAEEKTIDRKADRILDK